ncbi:MAG TPA: hypothetical protein VEX68_10865, partial [Bryobacteraceae bacterium]|nr:hypothetical protein [Bryobacteraceae bacterium]
KLPSRAMLSPNATVFQLAEPDTRRIVNRSATAFRIAASTLRLSDSYLGAQFRRFRSKLGAPKAITAMAQKLRCSSIECCGSEMSTSTVA